ncbi:hypothetical protein [Paraburkholderia xenovorans]|uniref:hypothetical protein n=1 Tax=Paraburkholderia xenovorans TaxID=36873 RepID=UPI0038B92578
MTLQVAVVTRAFDNDFRSVTCFALVTFDGKPVEGLKQKNFSLYSPAFDLVPRAPSSFGQPFLLTEVHEQDFYEKTTPHGLPGVYGLDVVTDNVDATGHFAWAPGWYVGIVEVTHSVDIIVGVVPGSPILGGERFIKEIQTYKAQTMFSFNLVARTGYAPAFVETPVDLRISAGPVCGARYLAAASA